MSARLLAPQGNDPSELDTPEEVDGFRAVNMADKDRTISEAHSRIDDLLLEVRQHVVSCSVQTRQQNSRLRRLEAILITTAGATILMLMSIIIQ